jgi:hypothetical protein
MNRLTSTRQGLDRLVIAAIMSAWAIMASFWSSSVYGQKPDALSVAELGEQAQKLLYQHCDRCHGSSRANPDIALDVREFAKMTIESSSGGMFLVPAKPEESTLWQQIDSDEMPQGDIKLSVKEKDLIRAWIEKGAPWPNVISRNSIDRLQALKLIDDDLSQIDKSDQPFQRYFSLVDVYNRKKASDADLRVYRAAFSKAINSLSHSHSIVLPVFLGPEKLICRLDERRLGWQPGVEFNELQRNYPYAIRPHERRAEENAVYDSIVAKYCDKNGIDLCAGLVDIRIDWFIARALAPKLYHQLAGIPEQLDSLYRDFAIDYSRDFRSSQIVRGGVLKSGVSRNNRLLEFFPRANRPLWMSYDFSSSNNKQSLLHNPLGPRFDDNPFINRDPRHDLSFNHAGGEVIFSLRNGLHGYMLVGGDHIRINEGPADIVEDKGHLFGTGTIRNGISCFGCHKAGLIPFVDQIKQEHAVANANGISKIREIYGDPDAIAQAIAEGQKSYLRALRECIGPFVEETDGILPVGDSEAFKEPITLACRDYEAPLGLKEVAAELGIDTDDLRASIQSAMSLQQIGLTPVVAGEIKREVWEGKAAILKNLFQLACEELNVGHSL